MQVILSALKRYGAILADNGGAWYLTGARDSRWDDDQLHQLHNILGSNLEAVDESALMSDPDSGSVLTGISTVKQVLLNVASAIGGAAINGNQVVLTAPAPPSGVVVSLQSANAAAAAVPAAVVVPGGATTASFSIQTSAPTIASDVTITAFYLSTSATAIIKLLPPAAPPVVPSAVVVAPLSAQGGAGRRGCLSLSLWTGTGKWCYRRVG